MIQPDAVGLEAPPAGFDKLAARGGRQTAGTREKKALHPRAVLPKARPCGLFLFMATTPATSTTNPLQRPILGLAGDFQNYPSPSPGGFSLAWPKPCSPLRPVGVSALSFLNQFPNPIRICVFDSEIDFRNLYPIQIDS